MAWKWSLFSLAGFLFVAASTNSQQKQAPPPGIIILPNCPPGISTNGVTFRQTYKPQTPPPKNKPVISPPIHSPVPPVNNTTNRIPIPIAPAPGEIRDTAIPDAPPPAVKAIEKNPPLSSIPPIPPTIPPTINADPATDDKFKSIADFPIPKKEPRPPTPAGGKPLVPQIDSQPDYAPKPPAETAEPPVTRKTPAKVMIPTLLNGNDIRKNEHPSSPWVVRVEVVNQKTHLYARSPNAEFHVVCKSLDIKTPKGEIRAEGAVTVSASGFDVHCDSMAISWLDDWVVMEGSVRLETEKNGQRVQLSGSQLRLKLTTLGRRNAEAETSTRILPASFEPNSEGASTFRPRRTFPRATNGRPETLPPPTVRPEPRSEFRIPSYKSPLAH